MQIGSKVTTRYFGGYEAVIVRQMHETYFVVARMSGAAKNLDGGEATDILPRDQVETVLGGEAVCKVCGRETARVEDCAESNCEAARR